MIVEIIFRRRAALNESISIINDNFVTKFVMIPEFWAGGKGVSDAYFSNSTNEGATLDLGKALGEGLKGQISYIARLAGYISDAGKSDDFLLIRANSEKIDYEDFCSRTFPKLVEIFEPYRGMVETDKDVRRVDMEVVRKQKRETGRDIEGRYGVFRIWPVNFFDDLLCRRSFGIGAEEVVARAAPECERAEVLNGGAFLLVTSDLVVGAALNDLDTRVMSRLNAP